jgi:hypothetical protein
LSRAPQSTAVPNTGRFSSSRVPCGGAFWRSVRTAGASGRIADAGAAATAAGTEITGAAAAETMSGFTMVRRASFSLYSWTRPGF